MVVDLLRLLIFFNPITRQLGLNVAAKVSVANTEKHLFEANLWCIGLVKNYN